MSAAGRHADALGIYLTGAAADGGRQPAQAASLGGYRSSTELCVRGHLARAPIAPLVVERITPATDEGEAVLRVDADGNLRCSTDSAGEGAGVALAAGDTALVASSDPDQAVRVRRRASGDPRGAMYLDVAPVFNNALAGSNVSDAQRTAGATTYRALMLRAHGEYGVLDIRAWIGAGTTQAALRLALEAPDAAGAIQTIADETTPPSGVSWSAPTDEASALHLGTLDVGRNCGLWIERAFPAGGNAAAAENIIIGLSFWAA